MSKVELLIKLKNVYRDLKICEDEMKKLNKNEQFNIYNNYELASVTSNIKKVSNKLRNLEFKEFS